MKTLSAGGSANSLAYQTTMLGAGYVLLPVEPEQDTTDVKIESKVGEGGMVEGEVVAKEKSE